ncbi:BlaI family transcriptional regulator, penicillinase repressor [Paenibacillus sp. 1_12]|uniref:BlaI/MecI/CopY family transcriptional regulator n=1 Tax=Paenibacillus sp. 1_12 TaxID=1566278 RepID=UPI0008E756D0|nr:BlaI/MecI/CopY family transcriptional regulator [Paenibacillus sp. 1_12]SFL57680.1 BlaI family transcriptional regulator, penicillinase repressor [Paenibacillus sp. 1_12]
MSNIPRISDSEWEIMRIIWTKSPCTANDVIELLNDNTNWKPNTVKTFISRLVKKNVVSFKEDGRSYYYYPLVSEQECLKAESQSFLKRIYGGALKPMLVNFIREDETLSPEDIAELKRLLNDKQ